MSVTYSHPRSKYDGSLAFVCSCESLKKLKIDIKDKIVVFNEGNSNPPEVKQERNSKHVMRSVHKELNNNQSKTTPLVIKKVKPVKSTRAVRLEPLKKPPNMRNSGIDFTLNA